MSIWNRRELAKAAMAIVQSLRESGDITIVASAPGLEAAQIVVGSLQATPRASVAGGTNS